LILFIDADLYDKTKIVGMVFSGGVYFSFDFFCLQGGGGCILNLDLQSKLKSISCATLKTTEEKIEVLKSFKN